MGERERQRRHGTWRQESTSMMEDADGILCCGKSIGTQIIEFYNQAKAPV